ncbi:MAG: ABC transporter substrate-binding protein [Pseudomonadota bacterium]
MTRFLTALALVAAAVLPARAEEPVLRLAVLKFGTVNWLTETIVAGGHDRAAGYQLEVVPLAGKAATSVAFQSGDADMIVTDWVWALGRRVTGEDLRFAPYSTALGALMAPPGTLTDLCALGGKRVGVVGGPFDKSWLVYEALAAERCGFSLAEATETLHGAPPLLSRQLETGGVEAVSTYWHFAARLSAAGMERVIDVPGALAALGIVPAPALVGFVWNAESVDPALAAAFLASAEAAGRVLASDDAAWEELRSLMRVDDEASFEALKRDYRAGIPDGWTEADTTAAKGLYETLAAIGGDNFARATGPWDAMLFETPAPQAIAGANGG